MMVLSRFAVFIPVLWMLLASPASITAQQPLPAEGDESQLLAILDSEAALFEKAKACQRLAIIGTPQSVPVLVKLLPDPILSHYARFALEANPSPKVDMAFRQALGEVTGPQLVGVINSIGSRRDTEAVDGLARLADGPDDEVAVAAVAGLGMLATPGSIVRLQRALSGKPSLRLAAADACLTAADRLLEEGKNSEALEILAMLRQAKLPRHINVAWRLGEIRSGSQDAKALMVSYLSDPDPDLFRIGLELAHLQQDAETTRQLLKQLETLPAQRQVLLIHVLGDRGDVSALRSLAELAGSEDAEIQLAAVRVLGRLGDDSVLPVLLKAAVSENEALATVARDGLAQLVGPEVDRQLADRLNESDGQERLVLVDVAGRRGIKQAIPRLLDLVSSQDAELRNLAIDGLGRTVGLEDFPQLVDQLLATGASPSALPMKEALRKACQRMGDRAAASQVLLERMATAKEKAQTDLMDLLVYVGGPEALAGAQAAAQNDDRSVANAATQALGKWLTPDVAPVLLELAQAENSAYRVRCLRGYIRVIRQFGLRPGQRLQMSKKAFAAASRDEERKLVLDTLTRFPLPQGLKMATTHLENPSLREAASQAAVAIGEKIVNNDPKSVAAAMKRVVAVTGDEELVERAQVLIARTQQKSP